MNKTKKKIWHFLDIAIITFFILLILLGWTEESNSHFGALFGFSIGIFFFTCEVIKDRLYFSKALAWVANNILKPRTKINHIFAGCLFIIGGFAVLMSSSTSPIEKKLFDEIKVSYEFWIGITLVLLFNILVGMYTSRTTKRKGSSSN
jgi:hypothetical protein